MAVTRCDLATIRGRIISAMVAGQASTWVTTLASVPAAEKDDRRNDTEIDKAVLAADARVCEARAKRVGDGYRSLFLALSASIAHAGVIPDHLGPIEQVTIQLVAAGAYVAGKFDASLTLADIERWRANAGTRYIVAHNAANSATAGYYIRRGSQLFYTGNDAKAQIATFVRSGACQAPESDEGMVFGLALGDLVKEGDAGPFIATIVNDARAEYAELAKQIEPSPSETLVLAA